MKKKIGVGLIVFFLLVLSYFMISRNQLMEVDVSKVEKGDMDKYIEENGVVKMADETPIYAAEGGKIVAIPVEVGDEVKAGDLLAKMDDKEILLQIKVLETQKQYIMAQYEEAKKPLEKEEIQKLEAQIRSVETAYRDLKRQAENHKKLYEEGAVSYDTYQNSLVNLTKQEADLEIVKGELTMAQNGLSNSVKKQYEAQITGAQAQIELLKKKQEDLIIKAPRDGIIMEKQIKIGSFVQPGMLTMEIGSKENCFLESDILTDEIGAIKEGTKVLISNEDLGIADIKGVVRKIYPKAFNKMSDLGIEQKRVKIEIDFIDPPTGLRPEYDMNIKIITASRKDVILIPKNAIFEHQGTDYVFVNDHGIARLRKIEKGIENGEKVEIVRGLKEGEEVILSPNEKMEEGIKVK